jgi:hypothetical protein
MRPIVIKKIESSDAYKKTCDDCDNELSKKDVIELLNLFKEHCLKADIMKSELYSYFLKCSSKYRIYHKSDIDEDEDNNLFYETMQNLRDNLHDKIYSAYYEARLLFMLKYYDKALIAFQDLLDNYKQIKESENLYYDRLRGGGAITEEEWYYYEERKKREEEEVVGNVTENINEIKEILGID